MSYKDDVFYWRTEAVRIKAEALNDMDNAYPDVGMGLHWNHYVDLAMKQLNLTENEIYYDALMR